MKHKGFTLIEFIVIISIFAIMSAVALFNYQGFRSSVSLGNLSRDIALTVRQAQVFGWGTSSLNDQAGAIQLDPITGNPMRFAEGVFFRKLATGGYASEMILYRKGSAVDVASFASYVPGIPPAGDTVVDTIKIQGPNQIASIQIAPDKSSLKLDANGLFGTGTTSLGSDLSVAFSRPSQQAYLFDGGNPVANGDYVGIYIAANADCPSPGTCTKYGHVIIISRSGEIVSK